MPRNWLYRNLCAGARASIIDERTGERVVKAFKKGGVLGAIGGVVRFAENDIVKALENLL